MTPWQNTQGVKNKNAQFLILTFFLTTVTSYLITFMDNEIHNKTAQTICGFSRLFTTFQCGIHAVKLGFIRREKLFCTGAPAQASTEQLQLQAVFNQFGPIWTNLEAFRAISGNLLAQQKRPSGAYPAWT